MMIRFSKMASRVAGLQRADVRDVAEVEAEAHVHLALVANDYEIPLYRSLAGAARTARE